MLKRTMSTILVLAGTLMLQATFTAAQEQQQQQKEQTTASQAGTDQDIQLLRQDLRSQKKQIVAANMQLTDAEATKFWPVYDEYAAELAKIGDTKLALIKEYAQTYDSMTDAQAKSLIKRWAASDEAAMNLRMRYIPKFEQVLPGKKAALFFQMDRRLGLLMELQVASIIPMVKQ